MSKNYLSFVITHGSLACCIRDVTEKLIVLSTDLLCYSNNEWTLEKIESDIQELIKERKPDKVLIFTDLVGGSCWLSANRIKKADQNIAVIGGVNVPMLVSYFINYERLGWIDLLEKISMDAIKGIVVR